jgi:hypothetical protein
MSIASCLALQVLMDALVSTSAQMAAEQQAHEFEQGLLEMRAEYSFEEPTNQPAMAVAE